MRRPPPPPPSGRSTPPHRQTGAPSHGRWMGGGCNPTDRSWAIWQTVLSRPLAGSGACRACAAAVAALAGDLQGSHIRAGCGVSGEGGRLEWLVHKNPVPSRDCFACQRMHSRVAARLMCGAACRAERRRQTSGPSACLLHPALQAGASQPAQRTSRRPHRDSRKTAPPASPAAAREGRAGAPRHMWAVSRAPACSPSPPAGVPAASGAPRAARLPPGPVCRGGSRRGLRAALQPVGSMRRSPVAPPPPIARAPASRCDNCLSFRRPLEAAQP